MKNILYKTPLLLLCIFAFCFAPNANAQKKDMPICGTTMAPKAFLGVNWSPTDYGILINNVVPESAASKADLKKGDVIVSVDGNTTKGLDYSLTFRDYAPNDKVQMVIMRNDQQLEKSVTLGQRQFHKAQNLQRSSASCCEGMTKKIKSNKPWLGVYLNDDSVNGALVDEVIIASPAAKSGLQAGDLIYQIDKEQINDEDELIRVIRNYSPDDKVKIKYVRNDKKEKVKLVLENKSRNSFCMPKPGCCESTPTICCEEWFPGCCEGWEECDPSNKKGKKKLWNGKKESSKIDLRKKPVTPEASVSDESINNTLALKAISVFPNPTDAKFSLAFESVATPVQVNIADLNGKTIYFDNVDNFDGKYNMEMDLSDYPDGIYLINITQDGKIYTEKLIFARK